MLDDVQDGIYARDSGIEYEALDAIRFSTLKEMVKSPRHYRHRTRVARKETAALSIGTLIHTAVLEPERLAVEYAVHPSAKRRYGKSWDDFAAKSERDGLRPILADDLETAQGIAASVLSDPVAGPLFASGGRQELTAIWTDEATGYRCKGRIDFLNNAHVLLDLKSSRDVEVVPFGRSCAKYLYHAQTAFYADAIERLTGRTPDVKLVVGEKDPPFDVVVYRVGESALKTGRDLYRGLLSKLSDCLLSDEWHGVAGGKELPLWLPGMSDLNEDGGDAESDWWTP